MIDALSSATAVSSGSAAPQAAANRATSIINTSDRFIGLLLLSRILSAAKVSTMLLDVACIGKGMHRILNKCSAKSDERSSSDESTHLTRVLI
jgi:hypothetical protein